MTTRPQHPTHRGGSRVLVDSGTTPDKIRCYYEIPDTLTRRLWDAAGDDATIADSIALLLDDRDQRLEDEAAQNAATAGHNQAGPTTEETR